MATKQGVFQLLFVSCVSSYPPFYDPHHPSIPTLTPPCRRENGCTYKGHFNNNGYTSSKYHHLTHLYRSCPPPSQFPNHRVVFLLVQPYTTPSSTCNTHTPHTLSLPPHPKIPGHSYLVQKTFSPVTQT